MWIPILILICVAGFICWLAMRKTKVTPEPTERWGGPTEFEDAGHLKPPPVEIPVERAMPMEVEPSYEPPPDAPIPVKIVHKLKRVTKPRPHKGAK